MKSSRIALAATLLLSASFLARAESLEEGFRMPPPGARPHTWWHWMNGNITKEGITADLEAMARAGVGGAQIFNAGEGIPHGPIRFNSPEWRGLVKHAAAEANRLGLELCMHNCAGWSSSGGPWNKPENGMQELVTSETAVHGPSRFNGKLPQPKTNLGFYRDIAVIAVPTADAKAPIAADAVKNLSGSLAQDGTLTWDVPAGEWTIVRFGHTANGRRNHPAPEEGTGLECDKLSREAAEAHWAGIMDPLLAELGPLAGKSFNNVLIDSYEVGDQNWTARLPEEFRKRRGYDLLPYLPALAGRVVASPEVTARFQWDFRRTLADLFAENYSGHFAEMAHRCGLLFSLEPYSVPFADEILYGASADIPMGEFWIGNDWGGSSIKLAASVAHVYGRKIVGAESFTAAPEPGRWQQDPYSLKAKGDMMYCMGLNRVIFHRYAHQPWLNRFPGMTMGQWGTHFERTETWWEQGSTWLRYLARCQYMLQQGLYVADAACVCGEGAPSSLRGNAPAGYNYDGCNADVVMNRMSVRNGRIVLPDGMSYRMLVLTDGKTMTPGLLRKLGELATAGATIIGPKPSASPSLTGYPQCDDEVRTLADSLWTSGKVRSIAVEKVLEEQAVAPDFVGEGLHFIHRTAGDSEIYFVANPRAAAVEVPCTFRVAGRKPELWHAESGLIETCPVWREVDRRTEIPLRLEPAGSVFVVFRRPAAGDHLVALRREGPAFQPAPRVSELVIRKALYGAFADRGEGWVNVTERALRLGDNAKIPATNEFAGGDPAPDKVKELQVIFVVGGKTERRTVTENQVVVLPPGAKVQRAIYGLVPEEDALRERTTDVTARLAAQVQDGTLSVNVDNDLAGGDPAFLVVKELRLEYLLNGVAKSARLREHQMLTLPPEGARSVPAAFEVTESAAGVSTILARAPGRFLYAFASGRTGTLDVASVPAPTEIAGPWEVSFPPNWGAPPKITLDKLLSWTAHAETGVKYFSGTAAYRKTFDYQPAHGGRQAEVLLDLGGVRNLGEVVLNGKNLGVLWKPPFCVDVTDTLREGKNELEIRVTNLWVNRLIGDEQLPDDREWSGMRLKGWPQWVLEGKPSPTGRFTFTTWHHWRKNDEPLESGLLGPVLLISGCRIPVKP